MKHYILATMIVLSSLTYAKDDEPQNGLAPTLYLVGGAVTGSGFGAAHDIKTTNRAELFRKSQPQITELENKASGILAPYHKTNSWIGGADNLNNLNSIKTLADKDLPASVRYINPIGYYVEEKFETIDEAVKKLKSDSEFLKARSVRVSFPKDVPSEVRSRFLLAQTEKKVLVDRLYSASSKNLSMINKGFAAFAAIYGIVGGKWIYDHKFKSQERLNQSDRSIAIEENSSKSDNKPVQAAVVSQQ
jgi:hypothetical protein